MDKSVPEMVKRVARALASQQGHFSQTDNHWQPHVPMAIAAIKAMRKPSDAMSLAGDSVVDSWPYGHTIATSELVEAYQAMIGAALGDANA